MCDYVYIDWLSRLFRWHEFSDRFRQNARAYLDDVALVPHFDQSALTCLEQIHGAWFDEFDSEFSRWELSPKEIKFALRVICRLACHLVSSGFQMTVEEAANIEKHVVVNREKRLRLRAVALTNPVHYVVLIYAARNCAALNIFHETNRDPNPGGMVIKPELVGSILKEWKKMERPGWEKIAMDVQKLADIPEARRVSIWDKY